MRFMRVLSLLMLIIFFISLIPTASALIVYLRPPKMILRVDVVPGQLTTTEGTFEIRNLNNVSIVVKFQPTGDIGDMTRIEKTITLEPNETRNVDFIVELNEPGTYKGGIKAVYSSETSPSVELHAEVTVIASQTSETNPYTGNLIFGLTPIHVGIIFIITIILLAVWYKRR